MKHGFLCGALIVFISCFTLSGASFAGIEIRSRLGPSIPAVNMTDTYSTPGLDAAFDIAFPVDSKWVVEPLYSFDRFFPEYPSDNLHPIGVGAKGGGAAFAPDVVPRSVVGIGYIASPHTINDGWPIIGGFGARFPPGKAVSPFLRGNVVIGGPRGAHHDAFVFFPLTAGLYLHGKNEDRRATTDRYGDYADAIVQPDNFSIRAG